MSEDKYNCKAVIALLGEIRDILIDIRDGNTGVNTTSISALSNAISDISTSTVEENNILS